MSSISHRLSWLSLSLTAFAFGAASSAHAACDRPVDPTRVVVFAGMNESLLEMKAAEEATCLRGETFIRLPAPMDGEDAAYVSLLSRVRIDDQISNLQARMEARNCPETPEPGTDCATMEARMDQLLLNMQEAGKAFDEYWGKLATKYRNVDISAEYSMLFRDLAAKNIKPTAIILSGHSDGSQVWGTMGGIRFDRARDYITYAYSERKELLNELNMTLLWGCNTISPYYSTNEWIRFRPGLKLLFGFAGSAPGATNPAATALLRSTLLSESAVSRVVKSATPESAIKTYFDALRGIQFTIGSAFVNDPDENRGWYYERTIDKNSSGNLTWTSTVKPLQTAAQCQFVRDQIQADQSLAAEYLSGLREIPADTRSGTLRELYTRARRNESCRLVLNFPHSADQIGYLLFWNDVKKNAVRYLGQKGTSPSSLLNSILAGTKLSKAVSDYLLEQENNRKRSILAAESEIETYQDKIAEISERYKNYQKYGDALFWTLKDDRYMKRLARRIRRFEKKVKRGKNVDAVLAELRQEQKIRTELGKLGPSFGNLSSLLASLTQEQNRYRKEIERNEDSIETLKKKTITVSEDRIRKDLNTILDHLPPATVESIQSVGFPELKSTITAAMDTLKQASTDSAELRSILPEIDRAIASTKAWLEAYQKIAVELRTNCLNFPTWHEYLENPTEAQRPVSQCY